MPLRNEKANGNARLNNLFTVPAANQPARSSFLLHPQNHSPQNEVGGKCGVGCSRKMFGKVSRSKKRILNEKNENRHTHTPTQFPTIKLFG